MSVEEDIKLRLAENFACLENKVRIQRPGRLFAQISQADFRKVFEYAVQELGFSHLISITGLDEGEVLSFVYHLGQDKGAVLNLKTSVPRDNPVLRTVSALFPGAEIYEKELVDLFGAKVEGLAPGNRYPLTDDWPKDQFPLRKDWKAFTQEERE